MPWRYLIDTDVMGRRVTLLMTQPELELKIEKSMTTSAKYENGVFKPLEDVKLTEGTRVEVYVPAEAAPKWPKSVRDLPIFGMLADRDDIPDGVTHVNRLRGPRPRS